MNKMSVPVICYSILLLVTFSVLAEDWTRWRGPNGDGISRERGILENWPSDGPKQLWRASLGLGYSGIVVSEGKVYTLFGKNNKEYCVALDEKTGSKIWQVELSDLFQNYFGSGPRATPTIDGQKIYAISAKGVLCCLNKNTGEKIWQVDMLERFNASNTKWGVSASPFTHEELLYYNIGGSGGRGLVALNKNTGRVAWQSTDQRAAYATPVFANILGQEQIIFFTADGLAAVTPKTGKLLWTYPWETSYDVNAASPIVYQNYVFISSGYSSGATLVRVSKIGGRLVARKVWKTRKLKNHFSSSIRWGAYIYGFHNAVLSCLDFRTGRVMWRQRGFGKGSLVGVDGHMLILGERGKLALAKLMPHRFDLISQCKLFPRTKCWTVPTIANGKAFIRNESEMVCLEIMKD